MRRIRTAIFDWFIDEIALSTSKTFALAAASGGVIAVTQKPIGHPLLLTVLFAGVVIADIGAWVVEVFDRTVEAE